MAYRFIDNYREKGARKQLVDILKQKGIEDEGVLNAIGKVKRHYFLIYHPVVSGRLSRDSYQ